MQNNSRKKIPVSLVGAVLLVWLVMNIRVAAGIGSTFERAVDGFVGMILLIGAVFIALDFFQLIGDGKNES